LGKNHQAYLSSTTLHFEYAAMFAFLSGKISTRTPVMCTTLFLLKTTHQS
jgi:hypothetical protein